MSQTLSRTYATPLRLDLRASRRLGVFLAASYASAGMLLPFMNLPASMAAGIMLLLLAGYLRDRQRHLSTRHRAAVATLVWGADDRVRLISPAGKERDAVLMPRAFIQPWLVILHIREPGGQARHYPVLPDMLGADDFRRLRVRLLIEMHHRGTQHG